MKNTKPRTRHWKRKLRPLRRRPKAMATSPTGTSPVQPTCSKASTRNCPNTFDCNANSSGNNDMTTHSKLPAQTQSPHAVMTMIQAIRSAMDVMLERDNNVVVFGQDVGYFGGVFRCTEGLQAKYGSSRVFDAPISESGIIGVAVGMGAYGLRPVAEIQFADYVYPAIDQIVSEAARLRYRSAGQFTAPVTFRMPCGGGIYGGQTHSQSPEAIFTQVCGLRTVMPSNPYDAKGLLIAAIEDPDPVIFLEPKRLYNGPFDGHHERPVTPWARHDLSETPDGHYVTPLGKAAIRRVGAALTVLAYGTMVHVAEAAAADTGVDAEIID